MQLPRHIYRTWTQADLRQACKLYAVTDPRWLGDQSLAAAVAEALVGGATMVQLRDKGCDTVELAQLARGLAPVCRVANVPLVIDDDIEAVKMSGVDGVHVGQSDASCARAREVLGPDAIVGVSVQTVSQAKAAEGAGASYLGVGAVFSTPTKQDADAVSLVTLTEICRAVAIPVVAIGGIDARRIAELANTGIDGVAVISALFASQDIEAAAEELRRAVDEDL